MVAMYTFGVFDPGMGSSARSTETTHTTYRTGIESNNHVSQPVNTVVEASVAMWVFGMLFAIFIFIIWLWSMISMISLNKKFNAFYEEYTLRENDKVDAEDDMPNNGKNK